MKFSEFEGKVKIAVDKHDVKLRRLRTLAKQLIDSLSARLETDRIELLYLATPTDSDWKGGAVDDVPTEQGPKISFRLRFDFGRLVVLLPVEISSANDGFSAVMLGSAGRVYKHATQLTLAGGFAIDAVEEALENEVEAWLPTQDVAEIIELT